MPSWIKRISIIWERVTNVLARWIVGFALVAVSACAGWDETIQLDKQTADGKDALCNYVYDSWGGAPVTSFCTPEDDGRLVPILVGQGERAEAVATCVADSSGTRWVDCPTADYVACAQEVEAAADVCVSQTGSSCLRLADCVSRVTTP